MQGKKEERSKRNEKAYIAENIVQEYFERIKNRKSRELIYDDLLKDIITSGDDVLLRDANTEAEPPVVARSVGSGNWASNSPLEITSKTMSNDEATFKLEFDFRERNISEYTDVTVLQITAKVSWEDGDLEMTTLTSF